MMIKGVDCPIKSGNDEKGKLQPADGRRLRGGLGYGQKKEKYC